MTKDQRVKTFEIISTLLIGGVSLGAVVLVLWSAPVKMNESEARLQAKSLAFQLMGGGLSRKLLLEKGGRLPASVDDGSMKEALRVLDSLGHEGHMAQDPWGEPYEYKILYGEYFIYAIVWSRGPNRTLESFSRDFKLSNTTLLGRFKDDDLGYIWKSPRLKSRK